MNQNVLGRKINGYDIITVIQQPFRDGGYIIVGYDDRTTTYIVARLNRLTDTEWNWGRYLDGDAGNAPQRRNYAMLIAFERSTYRRPDDPELDSTKVLQSLRAKLDEFRGSERTLAAAHAAEPDGSEYITDLEIGLGVEGGEFIDTFAELDATLSVGYALPLPWRGVS